LTLKIENMKNLKFGLISFLISSSVFARPVIGIGEYRYGPETSENIACQLAEDRAKEQAVLKFMGEIIQSTVTEDCNNENCQYEKRTENEIRGLIKNIIDRRIQNIVREGYKNCIVTIKANVDRIVNNIKFSILNKEQMFEDGQEVNFEVVSNKNGKVFVYNFFNGEYTKVFDEVINSPNRKQNLPSNQRMIARIPENGRQSSEMLMFLFVEEPLTNLSERYTMKEMNEVVSSLSFDKYKVVNYHVNIVRKS
jgi:hypothetical protein